MSTSPGWNACLTDAQIQDVLAAPPGEAPDGLAQHLMACDSCQQRVLFGTAPRPAGRRAQRPVEMPPLGRALLLGAAVLIAIGLCFYSLLKLVGRIE